MRELEKTLQEDPKNEPSSFQSKLILRNSDPLIEELQRMTLERKKAKEDAGRRAKICTRKQAEPDMRKARVFKPRAPHSCLLQWPMKLELRPKDT